MLTRTLIWHYLVIDTAGDAKKPGHLVKAAERKNFGFLLDPPNWIPLKFLDSLQIRYFRNAYLVFVRVARPAFANVGFTAD